MPRRRRERPGLLSGEPKNLKQTVMKALKKLEKNKTFWFLLGISVLFFFLRLPSLIEPYWYGDEGVYQVISKALIEGRELYSQIWDNKPPLLYLIYALFNGDQFGVRILSLIFGIATVILFFKLTTTIFKKQIPAIISTAFFALIFGTPVLEGNIANAENFMLLPIIGAAILIYKNSPLISSPADALAKAGHSSLPIAGLLLGTAFLLKTVALFDFAAFTIFLLIISLPENFAFKNLLLVNQKYGSRLAKKSYSEIYKKLRSIGVNFALSFLTPIILTGLYFFINKSFGEFVDAVFIRNINYVGYANNLLIPNGLLLLKLIIFLGVLIFLCKKRRSLSKAELFVLLWLIFSFFSSFFSGRPYPHYALLTLPPISALLGLILINKTKQAFFAAILIISIILINQTFGPDYFKSVSYYKNSLDFITGKKNVDGYRAFFDNKTQRDYEIASFIKTHALPDDKIFIWGDSPQIYKLAGKLPIGRYTVSYHIVEYDTDASETGQALQKEPPKYIIVLEEAEPFPFSLSSYSQKYIFKESMIYERDF